MKIFAAMKFLPADLRSVLDEIKAAIDGRATADRAAIANRDAIAAGKLRIAELEAVLAERDAEAVKAEARAAADADMKADATKAAKAADKANGELVDTRRAHERRIAAVEHLSAEAREIDATIADLKKRLSTAMTGYRKHIRAALNEDLLEACAPLIPVIQAALAVDAQIPDGGLARDWLDCAKLISPVDYRSDHLSHHVRVHGTDLLASQEALPSLPVGAMTAVQEIAMVSAALKQHRPYQLPKSTQPDAPKRTEFEQRKFEKGGQEAADQQRRWDQEEEQRAARRNEPPKGHSWVIHEPGARAAPLASQSRARAAATPADLGSRSLDGDVSGEYEWMNESQGANGDRGGA
ncbi:hypothetical protein ABH944_007786 [Caballeronia udeis]|uniref:Uncharacterized protein n=1 Tax=Caballeronia udeis TaxID=1232866 RepID=A0ABW8MYF4_9BURK